MKYKLKKCYPGSPEVGTEIFKWDYLHPKDERYNYNGNLGILLLIKPEDYPEFWEPIPEEKFEILEFNKKGITTRFMDKFDTNLLDDYLNNGYTITKIRRLFDNVEFSIGDKIKWDWINCGGNKYLTIKEFAFIENDFIDKVELKCNFKELNRFHPFLEYPEFVHYKEPLFTTEDGKDIFEGDDYYYVIEFDRAVIGNAWEPININSDKSCKSLCPLGAIQFSTKELAREYIDNNKPVYSKHQINSAISKCYISTTIGNFIKEDDFKQQLKL